MNEMKMRELLEKCASEKIHKLGQIQSFGQLIGVCSKTFNIKVISENFNLFGESSAQVYLGKNLESYIESLSACDLKDAFTKEKSHVNSTVKLSDLSGQSFEFYAHRQGDLIILEFESNNIHKSSLDRVRLLSSLLSVKTEEYSNKTIKTVSQNLAEKVRELIGYDRVMVYRFHKDNHGEVIAEAKKKEFDSFLGLHYPESDIPSQARKLYVRNLVRIIEDVESPRINLISDELNPDLSDSITRHVSPVHIEYMKNMGIRASLSISIVVDGKLWGLIACHHHSPRFIDFHGRNLLKFVSTSFSSEISRAIRETLTARHSLVNSVVVSFMEKIGKSIPTFNAASLSRVVDAESERLLKLMDSSNFYLKVSDYVAGTGPLPPAGLIDFLENKLSNLDSQFVYSSDKLLTLDPSFKNIDKAFSGAIAVGFTNGDRSCYAIWFRPESLEEISWAGENKKNIKVEEGVERLSPRGSFAEIVKLQENQSRPFNEIDEKVAAEFMWLLGKIMVDQLDLAERKVSKLVDEAFKKDLFISNLSHELRTPLNNILGWLHVIQDQAAQDETLAEAWEVISKNSKQQLNLINELLDSSKVSSGKVKLDCEEIDLGSLIEETCKFFKPTLNNKGLSLHLDLNEKEAFVSGDETRLQQIFRNILQNSMKFTPKGGNIRVSLSKKGSDYELSIYDDGIGIPKESAAQIFNPFFQVEAHKTGSNDGMGLGLNITKNLVELHGGRIAMFSEGEGQGTRVTVTLPVVSLRQSKESVLVKAPPKETPADKKFQNLKILLVEDNPDSARFVSLLLKKNGADVSISSHANEALSILEKRKFDLVISDIGLPEIDGVEFVKKAKKLEGATDIPFIALSAYGQDSEIKKSKEAGFESHLVKPVKFEQLTLMISEVLK